MNDEFLGRGRGRQGRPSGPAAYRPSHTRPPAVTSSRLSQPAVPVVATEAFRPPAKKASRRASKHAKTLTIALVGVVIVAVGVVGALVLFGGGASGIPKDVRSKVSYAVLYPADNTILNVSAPSVKYDSAAQRLVFNGQGPEGATISFSEQATPSGFVDVPQAYDKLVSSLQQYDSFGSVNGTVYLVHPKELHGAQAAVINTKGTLIFVQTTHDLSQNDWRSVFNNLQVSR